MTRTKEINANKLNVRVYADRKQMGAEAAEDVAERIKELLLLKPGFVNIIFAAAPSQNEFLSSLSKNDSVHWTRVNAFHMDEYIGLAGNASQTFAHFLKERLFDKVPFNNVYYINGSTAVNAEQECLRYAELLKQYPAHIVCMGIGENTHIAFNDPHTANFNDPLMVKVVTLDEVSRQQQVNDGCFAQIEDVPTSAITLTVPALLKADSIYCIVPGNNKARAVYQTLNSEVQETFPSTSL
ncbi:MAG: 6-phosphogluconolactonase, partial [Chitinophagaceae bacterium]